MSAGHRVNLDALGGLRGISSLTVVVGHLLTFWAPNEGLFPTFGLEYLSAVTLFFVISGFCLVCVYDKSDAPDHDGTAPLGNAADRRKFWRRRIGRLAPLYYLGMLLAVPQLIIYQDKFSIIASAVLSPLWLQAWTLVGNDLDGPLWTVSALAFCYLCFPSLLGALHRASDAQLKLCFIATTIISYTIAAVWLAFFGPASISFFLHTFPLIRIFQFIIGMCACFMLKRWGMKHPVMVTEVCSAILLSSQIMCPLITAMGGNDQGARTYLWFFYSYIAEYFLSVVHALWIAALCSISVEKLEGGSVRGWFGAASSSPTHWVLTTRPMQWLGEVSYAVYCLHWPIIGWCAWAVAAKGLHYDAVPLNNDGLWLFFPTWAIAPLVVIILNLSWVAHRFLEAPARAAIAGPKPTAKEQDVKQPMSESLLQGAASINESGQPEEFASLLSAQVQV